MVRSLLSLLHSSVLLVVLDACFVANARVADHFSTTDIHEPIDLYSEWIDQCEALAEAESKADEGESRKDNDNADKVDAVGERGEEVGAGLAQAAPE